MGERVSIKKKRKRKNRLKKILILMLTLVVIFTIGFTVVTKVFTVEKVIVKENKLYRDDQIQEWVLNDSYSWNSLYVFLKYRFRPVEDIPFIDTMDVSLESPHVLNIKVYEKGMLGYLYIDSLGQNVYFDKDGFVVEMSKDVLADVPKIKGVNCDKVVLYEKLQLESDNLLKNLLKLTNQLKKFKLSPENITYKSGSKFVLKFGKVEVNMGDQNYLEEKVTRLQAILPQLDKMSGTLHLENWTENHTDVSFEKTE